MPKKPTFLLMELVRLVVMVFLPGMRKNMSDPAGKSRAGQALILKDGGIAGILLLTLRQEILILWNPSASRGKWAFLGLFLNKVDGRAGKGREISITTYRGGYDYRTAGNQGINTCRGGVAGGIRLSYTAVFSEEGGNRRCIKTAGEK